MNFEEPSQEQVTHPALQVHPKLSAEKRPHFLHRPIGPVMIIAIIIGVILVRGWVIEGVIVDGDSMDPTLRSGERLLVIKKHFSKDYLPERGSVVIFPDPQDGGILVKRVIGLPGEAIVGVGNHIYINRMLLTEPYAYYSDLHGDYGATVIPQGKVWVLGDNRNNSTDSRTFGPVALDSIRGYAFLRMWPLPPASIPGRVKG
jgi:signal peptidase I